LKRRKTSSVKGTKADSTTPRAVGRPPVPVSPKVSSKVDLVLRELNIAGVPMATPAICKAFNDLRQDIVVLLDLQAHMQKKEYELQLLRIQKETLEKEVEERDKGKEKENEDGGNEREKEKEREHVPEGEAEIEKDNVEMIEKEKEAEEGNIDEKKESSEPEKGKEEKKEDEKAQDGDAMEVEGGE